MYINLELEEDIREIFEKTLKPDEIIRYIKLIKKTDIDIEKTIIFFDEIQTSERAITSLKYFEEANEKYKIVTAGSLLGVKLNRFKSSFPVGKVKLEYLCPMSFKEFLLAKNSIILIEEIEKSFYAKKPLPDSIHNLALKEYKDYLCIGGMPKAVLNYINNNNDVTKFDRTIHEDIITMYIADMRKYTYTATETVNIQKTYESMPSQLAKENKKFKYSIIEKGATSKKFESPLEWLISSGLLIKCTRIKLPQTPLKAYEDQDYFKMYLNDIGLLNALSRTNFGDILLDTEYMFKGAIAENYIAQVFANKRYNLHYWKSKSDAEVDFILDLVDGVIPVEVKADINTRSKSLNEYIQKYTPKYSIRISGKNFGYYNNIFSVPLYAAYLI